MNAAVRSVATVLGVPSLTATFTTAAATAAVAGRKAGGPVATAALIPAGGAGWQ